MHDDARSAGRLHDATRIAPSQYRRARALLDRVGLDRAELVRALGRTRWVATSGGKGIQLELTTTKQTRQSRAIVR
jgi:DNA primase